MFLPPWAACGHGHHNGLYPLKIWAPTNSFSLKWLLIRHSTMVTRKVTQYGSQRAIIKIKWTYSRYSEQQLSHDKQLLSSLPSAVHIQFSANTGRPTKTVQSCFCCSQAMQWCKNYPHMHSSLYIWNKFWLILLNCPQRFFHLILIKPVHDCLYPLNHSACPFTLFLRQCLSLHLELTDLVR